MKPKAGSGPPAGAGDTRFKTPGLALLLIMMVLAVYWPALRGDFVWDDDAHISANQTLRSLKGLGEIWFQPGATCQYYPLSFTVFWLDYHWWGLEPLGYHLQNVLLHGLAAVLLWQLLRRLDVPGAWLAGAIFAIHPVNVMSVAWMTELKNTLAAVLVLGAAWSYLRFAGLGVYAARSPAGSDWRWGWLSLALFQLALLAKTAVSFLPVTLLLLLWWKGNLRRWRHVGLIAIMLAMAAGMGLVTLHIERLHGATGAEFRMNLGERVLVSGRSFWFYLGKLFYPHPLNFIYERWKIDDPAWWQYAYPVAGAGLLASVWALRRRIGKGPGVALGHFYVATSFLVLIQVLYMMRYTFVSDHWQYFGAMSVIALVAAGIVKAMPCPGRWPQAAGITLVIVMLLALGTLTWRQCAEYVGGESLWRATLARNPGCAMAHYNLGQTYFQQRRPEQAILQYQLVLQISPDEPDACNNLGSALLQLGRVDEAVVNYQKALQLNPRDVDACNNLGNAFLRQGRTNQALASFQRALALKPDSADACYNLGNLRLDAGRTDDAIALFQKALAVKPNFAEAANNLGNAFLQQGRMDKAIEQYQRALTSKPDYADAHNNLGTAFLQQGRFDDSIRHYQQALAVKPDDTDICNNLGLAWIQKGEVLAAIGCYEKTLAIQPHNVTACRNLAWLLATWPAASARNGSRAVDLARRAVQLIGENDPMLLDTLAAAYAEAGRFPEAVAMARRALALAEAQSNADLAAELHLQLDLYQSGKPFHGPAPPRPESKPQ
ncbi:MAG TPA: tetratricopeptide repeat protein [Candidatus Acidoferrum sp.]|nr:tetratricopeptide repeat protein [Candidatus Acidoferrum sp.]